MRFLLFALVCFSCSVNEPAAPFAKIEIPGRSGQLLYRAKVPPGWSYKTYTSPDTTKAIAEFYYQDAIRLTFHNFPEMDIPPQAQVARWKKQFEKLQTERMAPQTFSGYVGLLFEGSGKLDGEEKGVMGWAMELAPEQAQYIQEAKFSEMRASFTLKAVGPKELMAQERGTIFAFAKSFELIDELPGQL